MLLWRCDARRLCCCAARRLCCYADLLLCWYTAMLLCCFAAAAAAEGHEVVGDHIVNPPPARLPNVLGTCLDQHGMASPPLLQTSACSACTMRAIHLSSWVMAPRVSMQRTPNCRVSMQFTPNCRVFVRLTPNRFVQAGGLRHLTPGPVLHRRLPHGRYRSSLAVPDQVLAQPVRCIRVFARLHPRSHQREYRASQAVTHLVLTQQVRCHAKVCSARAAVTTVTKAPKSAAACAFATKHPSLCCCRAPSRSVAALPPLWPL